MCAKLFPKGGQQGIFLFLHPLPYGEVQWEKYLCLKQDTRADGVGVEAGERRSLSEDFRGIQVPLTAW